jgi:hypothetical protein
MSRYTVSQIVAWQNIPHIARAGESVLALLRDGAPIVRVPHAEHTAQTLQAVKLAQEFSRRLLAAIGPDALAAVVADNAGCTIEGVCHTHDYCDANQVMIDSLPAVGQSYDGSDSEQWGLIDTAWEIARATDFDA